MASLSSKSTNISTDALKVLREKFSRPTFGEVLESVRICDEVSQVELARKMGISRQDLCNIEKGRTQVSLERAKKFAKVLGYGELTFASYVLQDMLDRAGIAADLILNEKKSS